MEYLYFPRYGTVSQVMCFFIILLGLLACFQAFRNWQEIIRDHKAGLVIPPDKHEKEDLQQVLATLIGPLFVIIGFTFLVTNNWSIYQMRSVRIDNIRQVSASRVNSERDRFPRGTVNLTDENVIREGLSILKNCTTEVSKQKEHFTNGIMLEYKSEQGEPLLILYDYRSTNVSNDKRAIQAELSCCGTMQSYSCPTFQEWVDENVTAKLK